ncbi:MAG TPA: hypothetical protein VLU73_16625 [Methylococcaceae bacterium]|nr:hypothetical protein [Methylococcaceae bacterium]
MNKIVLAVLVAVIGVAVWLALRAKYKVRGFCRRFLGNWRKDRSASKKPQYSAQHSL